MIVGTRVTLRPFRQEDIPILRRWHSDPAVMRYWGDRYPLVGEHMFAEDLAPNGRFTKFERDVYFCICDETARPIGRIDAEGLALPERSAELSIFIGEQDAWSKGYGTEAIVLLLEWLFNDRGTHRVWLDVFADNPRAISAYEKVGFVREGTKRESWFVEGRWHDEHLYSMLRREYNARYHGGSAQHDDV